MSLFGNAVMRLLREGWQGPRQLAEEIFAILSTVDLPLSTSGGVSSGPNSGVAPFTAELPVDGDLIMSIKKNGKDLPLSLGPADELMFDGQPIGKGQQAKPSSGLSASSATVKSGTGTQYLLTLPAGNAVAATCLGIAPDEQVPAGTQVIAFKPSGSGYFFQVPVWM